MQEKIGCIQKIAFVSNRIGFLFIRCIRITLEKADVVEFSKSKTAESCFRLNKNFCKNAKKANIFWFEQRHLSFSIWDDEFACKIPSWWATHPNFWKWICWILVLNFVAIFFFFWLRNCENDSNAACAGEIHKTGKEDLPHFSRLFKWDLQRSHKARGQKWVYIRFLVSIQSHANQVICSDSALYAGALRKARIARVERNECCKSLVYSDEPHKWKFLFWNFRSIQWQERWAIIFLANFFGEAFLFSHHTSRSPSYHPFSFLPPSKSPPLPRSLQDRSVKMLPGLELERWIWPSSSLPLRSPLFYPFPSLSQSPLLSSIPIPLRLSFHPPWRIMIYTYIHTYIHALRSDCRRCPFPCCRSSPDGPVQLRGSLSP